MKRLLIVFQVVAAVVLSAQDIIDVGVRGISDANRDGVQKDRLEANYMSTTILASIIIIIISQYLLKFILGPLKELKQTILRVSFSLQ
ncbi:MAG: hypothetical protein KAU50_10360 [Candidatus Marinimicrobia bacterium]|nr:hypothetical protein [Candidatus Neomarinimicrobiota bacterium]